MSQDNGSVDLSKDKRKQNIGDILREKQEEIEHNIEGGTVPIDDAASTFIKNNGVNPFESRYKAFLLNSDRQKSKQRYEAFKKLRQDYSFQNTAIAVKQVQSKIKEWAEEKKNIKKKKEKSVKKDLEKQISRLKQIEETKNNLLQKQKEKKKRQIQERIKIMEKQKKQRQKFIRETKNNIVGSPKYLQYQQKFLQFQSALEQQRKNFLKERQQSMKTDVNKIKQHEKEYIEIKKKKQEERKNILNRSNIKIAFPSLQAHQKVDFTLKLNQNELQTKQKKQKQKRRQQFNQKLLKKLKKQPYNSSQKSLSKPQEVQKKVKYNINPQANHRTLGKQYLIASRQLHRVSNSYSTLPDIVKHSTYKNYLKDIKIVRKAPADEISELKKKCKNEAEFFQTLTHKSDAYEESMMRKIMELKKINKYEDSVTKENQIDDLYTRALKIKLACISDI